MNVIGLMSGTSLDAIDAALVEIKVCDDVLEIEVRSFVMQPLDNAIRDAVRQILPPNQGSTRAVCELNFALGEAFAKAAQEAIKAADLTQADLIASHGQTVFHVADSPRSTLQISNPAVIAARTNCTVISDFRSRDIALGGHGAPLVPWFDALLFRDTQKHRVALNIGGMANLSYVPPKGEILAFDTGPGNVLIDEGMRFLTNGAKTFDENGSVAQSGTINQRLLQKWLDHPYFQMAPPKSTGRELFGPQEAQSMVQEGRKMGLSDSDILATLTALTARTISDAINSLPHVDELIVGGGGARNTFLMQQIETEFQGTLREMDSFGIASEAKEAVAFAVMGFATFHSWPSNLISATGASQSAILGSITPGENYRELMLAALRNPIFPPSRLVVRQNA